MNISFRHEHLLTLLVLHCLVGCSSNNTEDCINSMKSGPTGFVMGLAGLPIGLTGDILQLDFDGNVPSRSGGSSSGSSNDYTASGPPSYAPTSASAGAATMPSTILDTPTIQSGSWDVPHDIYLNDVTHQAQVPVTVIWSNKATNAFDRLTISVRSDDPTRPVFGTGFIQITSSDPTSGSKTEYVTITGSRTTSATFKLTESSLTGAWAGQGENIAVTVHGY